MSWESSYEAPSMGLPLAADPSVPTLSDDLFSESMDSDPASGSAVSAPCMFEVGFFELAVDTQRYPVGKDCIDLTRLARPIFKVPIL